jgi:hypothetical protein
MNKVSSALAAAILLVVVLGCSKIAEKVITPGENFTRTNELWSDVPTMDGMTHSDEMDLPFTAKLLIRFALNNLWRANNDNSADNTPVSGDWTAFTSKASTDDIEAFYSKDRMASFGQWDTEKESNCVDGKKQGVNNGVICVYKKVIDKHATLLAIMSIRDDKKNENDIFFLRLEKDVESSPSPKSKGK